MAGVDDRIVPSSTENEILYLHYRGRPEDDEWWYAKPPSQHDFRMPFLKVFRSPKGWARVDLHQPQGLSPARLVVKTRLPVALAGDVGAEARRSRDRAAPS